jgi:hypothetical protein
MQFSFLIESFKWDSFFFCLDLGALNKTALMPLPVETLLIMLDATKFLRCLQSQHKLTVIVGLALIHRHLLTARAMQISKT